MATTMSPGDVRTFKQGSGKAVVVGLGLWANRQGKWIHIHMTGPDHSQTTVTNNPDSERYHRMLFRNLRRTLISENCWEFGDEGNEVEQGDASAHFRPVPIHGRVSASEIIISDRGE